MEKNKLSLETRVENLEFMSRAFQIVTIITLFGVLHLMYSKK